MIFLVIFVAIVGVCLICLALLMFFFQGLPGGGPDYLSIILVFLLGAGILFGAFCLNSLETNDLGYDQGYKQGQIDAANGIQKYHLTTRPKVWKKKAE